MEKGLVFGLRCGELLGIYDQNTQLWKTCQPSLFEDLIEYLERLPKSGIMQNGRIYRQQALAHHIEGKEYGYWLTTIATQISPTEERAKKRKEYRESIGRKDASECLLEQVMRFPTPCARDWKGTTGLNWNHETLPDYVKKYPTPGTTGLSNGSGNCEKINKLYKLGMITEEERRSMRSGNGGKLNPDWVDWLMGYPIGWTELGGSGMQLSLK